MDVVGVGLNVIGLPGNHVELSIPDLAHPNVVAQVGEIYALNAVVGIGKHPSLLVGIVNPQQGTRVLLIDI